MALAALILGVLSAVFATMSWFFYGIIFAPVAVVLGVIAIVFGAKNKNSGLGIGGLVTGIVGGTVGFIELILVIIALIRA